MQNKFRKNFHIAKRLNLNKVKHTIQNYPKEYATPKYLLFIKNLLEDGWAVKLYTAGVSKYVFCLKGDHLYKIRFSNHKPRVDKELEEDCDFYVGVSNLAVNTTEEIEQIIKDNYNQTNNDK